MIDAILIDDEKNALEVLQWQLATYCTQVHVVASCLNADDGIEAINRLKPGLIFLDIEMPKKNGFEVLQSFPAPSFEIIFTTAYNQFALKAFKVAALDYLLKPIDAEDLIKAVKRSEKNANQFLTKQQLELFLQQYTGPVLSDRLSFSTGQAIHFIEPCTILYCGARSNYTELYFTNKSKMIVCKTLKEVEDMLLRYHFYRLHHSFLINLKQVCRYVKTDGGYVVLSDGSQLPVSRIRKEGLVQALQADR